MGRERNHYTAQEKVVSSGSVSKIKSKLAEIKAKNPKSSSLLLKVPSKTLQII